MVGGFLKQKLDSLLRMPLTFRYNTERVRFPLALNTGIRNTIWIDSVKFVKTLIYEGRRAVVSV